MNVIPLHIDSHQNLCISLCVYSVHVYTIFIKIHSLVSKNMFRQKKKYHDFWRLDMVIQCTTISPKLEFAVGFNKSTVLVKMEE